MELQYFKFIKSKKYVIVFYILIGLLFFSHYLKTKRFFYESTTTIFVDENTKYDYQTSENEIINQDFFIYNFAKSTQILENISLKHNLKKHYNLTNSEDIIQKLQNSITITRTSEKGLNIIITDENKETALLLGKSIFDELSVFLKNYYDNKLTTELNILKSAFTSLEEGSSKNNIEKKEFLFKLKQTINNESRFNDDDKADLLFKWNKLFDEFSNREKALFDIVSKQEIIKKTLSQRESKTILLVNNPTITKRPISLLEISILTICSIISSIIISFFLLILYKYSKDEIRKIIP